jgi:hypothetical protein
LSLGPKQPLLLPSVYQEPSINLVARRSNAWQNSTARVSRPEINGKDEDHTNIQDEVEADEHKVYSGEEKTASRL